MAQIKIKLKPFLTPNFALMESPPRSRQEGFNAERNTVPLSELSVEALDELCQEFRANVFQKAGKSDPKN